VTVEVHDDLRLRPDHVIRVTGSSLYNINRNPETG
jgi:hypothetical protein